MKRDAQQSSSTAEVNPEKIIIPGTSDSSKQIGLMRKICGVIANNGYPWGSIAVFPATAFMMLHLKSNSGVRFQMWFILLVVRMVETVHIS